MCSSQWKIREESRPAYVGIIEDSVRRGSEVVILGCTEIPLLIEPKNSPVPVFDTMAIHAATAGRRISSS